MKSKRIMAVITAATMLTMRNVGLISYNPINIPAATASAAEAVKSGTCGENVTWTLDSEGTLTISGEGEMNSWALNPPWKDYAADIKQVIIKDGVTTIGEHAFSDCHNIEDVSIPASVKNIKTGAFFCCFDLTSITIPESVTEIGHSVFYGCISLKEINIPGGVNTINSGLFRECESLTTITFPENVKKVDYTALCSCTSLESVVFENPECKIADAEYTICNSHDFDTKENVFNGAIYGYTGSTAQAYAEKYNRTFVALDGEKPVTTTAITTTSTSTTTTTTVAVDGNVSWQMPDITVEKGTEIIEVPVSLLDYDNSQLAVYGAEFTLTYDYNALELVGLTSKSDAYCTDTIFNAAINQFSIETGSGNAIAGEHLANVVVFRFRIKDMSLNQDYFIRIENLYAYDANGRNISDHIKTNDGCVCLVEEITTTTTTTPTTANSTTITSTTTSTTSTLATTTTSTVTTTITATSATTTTSPVTTEPYFILGDANADGSVDSSDASLVLAEYAKMQTGGAGEFTKTQHEAADVNNDGVVDSSDASKILAYYAMVSTGKEPAWD